MENLDLDLDVDLKKLRATQWNKYLSGNVSIMNNEIRPAYYLTA